MITRILLSVALLLGVSGCSVNTKNPFPVVRQDVQLAIESNEQTKATLTDAKAAVASSQPVEPFLDSATASVDKTGTHLQDALKGVDKGEKQFDKVATTVINAQDDLLGPRGKRIAWTVGLISTPVLVLVAYCAFTSSSIFTVLPALFGFLFRRR